MDTDPPGYYMVRRLSVLPFDPAGYSPEDATHAAYLHGRFPHDA